MAKRYFVTLSYDGTNYHGWQVQPNGISVQGELQRVLSTLLRQEISITGAGRTDAGVHARVMVAHFDYEGEVDCKQLAYKMNRMLPKDIAVSKVEEVAPDMHARFSATERTYHYYIHTRKDGRILMEYEDFGAFCKAHSDVKTTLCHVTRAEWIQTGETDWYFVISANRFLRNMVRAVVGTLIDVGRGRLSEDGLRAVIEGRKRSDAGDSMPGNALFLEDVKY